MIAAEPVVLSGSLAAPSKIQGHHFERLAAVYLRQSTPQQVLEHRESTALQYALRTRAIQWGWPAERVLVIDDDLGCTAIRGRLTHFVRRATAETAAQAPPVGAKARQNNKANKEKGGWGRPGSPP